MKSIDYSPGPKPIVYGSPLSIDEADKIRFTQLKNLRKLLNYAKSKNGAMLQPAQHKLVSSLLRRKLENLTEKQLVMASFLYAMQWALVYDSVEFRREVQSAMYDAVKEAKSIRIKINVEKLNAVREIINSRKRLALLPKE
jgi:hypothetical protein